MPIDNAYREALFKHLGKAKKLKFMLAKYLELLERYEEGTSPTASFTEEQTYYFYVEAKKRFDKNPTGIGRNQNSQLKAALKAFRSSQKGKRFPYEAVIPDGSYGIEILKRNFFLNQFWAPYIRRSNDPTPPVQITYTEHNFYYAPGQRYLIYLFDGLKKGENVDEKCNFIPVDHHPLKSSRQFVNTSEVSALLWLAQWFESLSIPLEFIRSHWSDAARRLPARDLVLLATGGDCEVIQEFQVKFNLKFRVQKGLVQELGLPGGSVETHESKFTEGKKIRGYVTRVYEKERNRHITIIASNHGRFNGVLGEVLTNELRMQQFLEESGLADQHPLPERFEILLEIDSMSPEEHNIAGSRFEVMKTYPPTRKPQH